MNVKLVWIVLAASMLAVVCASLVCAMSDSRKAEHNLPIVTGNLSVYWIQHSPVGAWPEENFQGEPVTSAEEFARLHRQGLNAYEDYVAWGAVEREPGKWDWSRQIAMADAQRAGGMEYDPYLWIHNPPMWMREGKLPCDDPDAPDHYTLLRCLEHNQPTYTLSIFDPATVKWFGRFYREMHKALGDKIGRTYVGLIGPYGEGNYPLPMFAWLNIGHCHEGYWCGDEYTRTTFREAFRKRYGSLGRLNDAWGTSFRRWEEVDFPPEIAEGRILKAEQRTEPKARRRWVDFIEWYHQSIIDFSVEVTKAALQYFPIERLKMKPGGSAGGVNPIPWGTYCPGYAKAHGSPAAGVGAERTDPPPGLPPIRREVRRLPSPLRGGAGGGVNPLWSPLPGGTCDAPAASSRLRLQPADCGGRPFGDRWYGTAYRFYGVPLTTEPGGGLSQRDFRRRVFMDACNGATEMFSYQWDKHKLDGIRWIRLYRGVPSVTDAAVYCPTTWYRMNGSLRPTIEAADALRDITDFEVADELLINDDYLRKANTRVLIWLQGSVVERSVLDKVVRWVEDGGILVACAAHPPTDVEGHSDLGLRLFPDGPRDESGAILTPLGRGVTIRYPHEAKPGDPRFTALVRDAIFHPEKFRDGLKGAPEFDGEADGVWTAVFPDRLLLMNVGDAPAEVERAWDGRTIRAHLEVAELAEVRF